MLRCFLIFAILVASYATSFASENSDMEFWRAGAKITLDDVARHGIDRCFRAEAVNDRVFERMAGRSYKKECTIPRSELRYVKVLHRNADGDILLGELVVHARIADRIVRIFKELYEAAYPIERMVLVDDYAADDNLSMEANNSSAFNYRTIPTGGRLSAHSRGVAIDINPRYNPYVKRRKDGSLFIAPTSGAKYVNRAGEYPYKITREDLCCRLFLENGFEWGGDYRSCKDYQHFELIE